jgi:hypothetical protein
LGGQENGEDLGNEAANHNQSSSTTLRQHRHAFGFASLALFLNGWLWLPAAFVARESALWNSIGTGLAIFGGSAVLAFRALPSGFGVLMLVVAGFTFVLLAVAFGPSLLP